MLIKLHDEAEFHAFRAQGLGSSDMPAVLGVSRWKTAYELWLEKTGQLEPEDKSGQDHIIFGHALEEVIAQEFARRSGRTVRRTNCGWVHPEHAWARCVPDRTIVALEGDDLGPGLLECKTTAAWLAQDWGPSESAEPGAVPVYYEVQVHHQLAVSGYRWAVLAVLIGGNDLRLYPIHRDEELIANLLLLGAEFWRRVQELDPPAPDYDHPTTLALLARRHGLVVDQAVDLDESLLVAHRARLEALEWVRSQQAVADGLKARILFALGDAGLGRLPDGSCYERRADKNGRISLHHKPAKAAALKEAA